MKNVDLDFVFGSDDAPMPLPRFEAVTQGNEDAQNPFENFFRDAVIAAAVGGDEEFDKFKSASANVSEKFAERYRKIAHEAEHKTTAPIAAAVVETRRCVKKERTVYPSGGVVVAELDQHGVAIRTYQED
jgi:hypothetical protein